MKILDINEDWDTIICQANPDGEESEIDSVSMA
jgi:hypothetical protein